MTGNNDGPSSILGLLRQGTIAASRQPRRWMSLWIGAGFIAAGVLAITHAPQVAWWVLGLIMVIAVFTGLVLADDKESGPTDSERTSA